MSIVYRRKKKRKSVIINRRQIITNNRVHVIPTHDYDYIQDDIVNERAFRVRVSADFYYRWYFFADYDGDELVINV